MTERRAFGHAGPNPHRRTVPLSSFILHPASFVFVFLLLAVPVEAADATQAVWLISTREAPTCGDLDSTLELLRYCRMDDNGCWEASDAAAFSATDDVDVPTIVFFHGNRTNADDAVWKAMYTYDLIRANSACRSFRYVIWSWPAERMLRHNQDDVRLKAAFSDVQSYYLAQWLSRIRPGVPLSLIGHSFGPRIITGAMHLLGGGTVAGRNLSQDIVAEWSGGKRNTVRAVLLAAAIDSDWLCPGGCHGEGLVLFDQVLVTANDRDLVLRWYARLYDHCRPQALGLDGPCSATDRQKIVVVNVSCEVGRRHDWRYYSSASPVCCRWSHYTFLGE